jgi:6-phosphofructokinase 1
MGARTGNVLIGQSGGPTHVINQSLVGVVETAVKARGVRNVYGAIHGIKGVIEEKLIDLGRESRVTLEAVATTPGAGLRSVRKKPTREECEQALDVFRRYDIRYFFYIGGNDSAETANLLNEIAVAARYDLRLYHVPKTIDNDLRGSDHCPGYPSAARYVALALMGDNMDTRSLPGVKLDVIMGRHAGWLTAASVLARQHADDGPHLVYCPETNFSIDGFVADVDRVYTRLGRCVVALSEGIHDASGRLVADSKDVDSHGNVQLSGSGALGDRLSETLKRHLGEKLRVRADTFGYSQRSFAGVVSPIDAAEAREAGRTAARLATEGDEPHGSVALLREPAQLYRVRFERIELAAVARETRCLDARFLRGANDIDEAFLEYVRPLVGELPRMARLSDHPVVRPGA